MTRQVHGRSFVKFLASGAVNTLVTYLVYLALLQVLSYRWSYTVSYVAGIGLAYLLYRYFVFKKSAGKLGPVWVTLVYLLQYVIGLALVTLWVQVLEFPALWAPVFAVVVSVPMSYGLNRLVFRGDARHARPDTAEVPAP